jgi:hypothetical protein
MREKLSTTPHIANSERGDYLKSSAPHQRFVSVDTNAPRKLPLTIYTTVVRHAKRGSYIPY